MIKNIEISRLMIKHLKVIDNQLDEMIRLGFDHKSIHAYRESIRRFRALLFFFIPSMSAGQYRFFEMVSERNFDMTSLIREIDVFETGYGNYMKTETLEKLAEIKKPLLERLIEDTGRMYRFTERMPKMVIRSIEEDHIADYEKERQFMLFKEFIETDAMIAEGQEKYILNKRMLAKKLHYIHEILMPGNKGLDEVNEALASFQVIAKQLHDVCVNLRFVGQYQLDDSELIAKLVQDHVNFSKQSDAAYDRVCAAIVRYMERAE